MTDKLTGIVKWFNNKKGYGFIIEDSPQNTQDIFVHFRSIQSTGYKTLKRGQKVEFTLLTNGEKGLHAENVSPLEGH